MKFKASVRLSGLNILSDSLTFLYFVNRSGFSVAVPLVRRQAGGGSREGWNCLTKEKRKINGGKKTLPVLQNAYLSSGIKIRKIKK
jgi:hypothetical protein